MDRALPVSPHLTKEERGFVEREVKRWLRGETSRIVTPPGVTVEMSGEVVLAVAKQPPKKRRI